MSIFDFRQFIPPPAGSFVDLPGIGVAIVTNESRHTPREDREAQAEDKAEPPESFFAF